MCVLRDIREQNTYFKYYMLSTIKVNVRYTIRVEEKKPTHPFGGWEAEGRDGGKCVPGSVLFSYWITIYSRRNITQSFSIHDTEFSS